MCVNIAVCRLRQDEHSVILRLPGAERRRSLCIVDILHIHHNSRYGKAAAEQRRLLIICCIHRDDIPDAASRLIGKRGCNGGLIRTLRQPAGQHIRLIDSPVIQRADCNADLMIVYFRMYRLTVDADRIRDTVQCL